MKNINEIINHYITEAVFLLFFIYGVMKWICFFGTLSIAIVWTTNNEIIRKVVIPKIKGV